MIDDIAVKPGSGELYAVDQQYIVEELYTVDQQYFVDQQYTVDQKYRVIKNNCRGFNNLSYTIHLR